MVGLASGAGVAAELQAPSRIEGLRACGTGGFALPGSSGCIRLSGRVAAETTLRTNGGPHATARRPASLTDRVESRTAVDIRVPTELGDLRAYTSLRFASPRRAGQD